MQKLLVPLGAALALLVLFAGVRMLVGSSSPRLPADSPPAAGERPSGGRATGPGGDGGGGEPRPSPPWTDTQGVAVDSYYRYDERRLAINYSIGVPECYGTIDVPRVVETADSVAVTLPLVPPKQSKNQIVCIEIALTKSVDITLERPLGNREVLDGSAGSDHRAAVNEASAPAGDGSGGQAY